IKTLSYGNYQGEIASFVKNGGALSSDAKGQVLDQLKGYSRDDLTALGLPIVCRPACAEGCDWRAQDCTIDLATVVRLSEGGTTSLPNGVTVGGMAQTGGVSSETNVRGIANIVQIKSGHGAVIGGLI